MKVCLWGTPLDLVTGNTVHDPRCHCTAAHLGKRHDKSKGPVPAPKRAEDGRKGESLSSGKSQVPHGCVDEEPPPAALAVCSEAEPPAPRASFSKLLISKGVSRQNASAGRWSTRCRGGGSTPQLCSLQYHRSRTPSGTDSQ